MNISQREARRLRKRVEALQREIDTRRNAWASEYPGGVHLGTVELGDGSLKGAVYAARLLKHAVVVTLDGTRARFYALPEAKL